MSLRTQTLGEEIANSVSHGVGLIASLAAAPFLIGAMLRRGDAMLILAAGCGDDTTTADMTKAPDMTMAAPVDMAMAPTKPQLGAQIAARGMVLREDGLMQFAPPLKFSGHDFAIRQAAPQAGEHNEEILRAAGYPDAEIDRLKAAGVLG